MKGGTTIVFEIPRKREHKRTDKAICFLTSGYGGEFFSVPFSHILETRYYNKENELMMSLEVSQWIWDKIDLGSIIEKVNGAKMIGINIKN